MSVVKIVSFSLYFGDSRRRAEQTLAEMLDDGWRIVANGGGGSASGEDIYGFVVLQHEDLVLPELLPDETELNLDELYALSSSAKGEEE